MDIATITFLIIGAMAFLLLLGVPLAFVSGAIAAVLAVSQFGLNALFIAGSRTVDFLDSFSLIAVPMFVLMASIMKKSGVARDLYRAFHVWAGSVRGGIGVVTTGVAVLLGATTGIIWGLRCWGGGVGAERVQLRHAQRGSGADPAHLRHGFLAGLRHQHAHWRLQPHGRHRHCV